MMATNTRIWMDRLSKPALMKVIVITMQLMKTFMIAGDRMTAVQMEMGRRSRRKRK